MSVVLIGLGNDEASKSGTELHKILSILLSQTMGPAAKEKYLQDEFGFDIGSDMKGVWQDMCNLSDLIEEQAIERGMAKGMAKGIEKGQYITLRKLVHSGKLTIEDAAATADISVEELKKIFETLLLQ